MGPRISRRAKFWRALVLAVAVFVAACGSPGGSTPAPTPTPSPQVTPTVDPLAGAAISLVERTLDAYAINSLTASVDIANHMASPDLVGYTGTNPYLWLAYEVSALSRASQALSASDPARASRYMAMATKVSDYLVQHKDDNGDGKTGWGLPNAWDAFQDGTINPPNTVYAFETSLVSDGLIDTYLASHNSVYLQTAEDAMAAYLPFSTTTVDAGCANCRYFWYSIDKNDAGRLVKNINVLMGSVLARLAFITKDSAYQATAEQVYATQVYEVGTRSNYHYLGYDDPRYSPTGGMDAHLATEIWAFNDMTLSLETLGSPVVADGPQILSSMAAAFWQCGSVCQAALSTIYGVRVACELAPAATDQRALCDQAIQLYSAPGASPLSLFPILGVLRYLTLFGYIS
jgi:hypothetical protein